MKATIINIGDELLIGQVVNTNASPMAQMLIAAGIDVWHLTSSATTPMTSISTSAAQLPRSDVVLITGGLGPTKDDITKKTLCDFFHSELYENQEALANVKRIFDARGYELTPINRQQAWVPRCCTMINNVVGTAPCMWFELPQATPWISPPSPKVVVSMPGVPFEMVNLMETEIIPRLQQHFRTDQIINKNILVQGIGESFLSDLIEPWELALPSTIRWPICPSPACSNCGSPPVAERRASALLQQQIADAVKALSHCWPIHCRRGPREPARTGGLHHEAGTTPLPPPRAAPAAPSPQQLTALAGASEYYKGGVVAYSNEVKECALGVSHDTLEPTVPSAKRPSARWPKECANGSTADYAVATTGIAGPGGGTPQKPVGTVWIAVANAEGITARLLKFGDRRAQTIERTCNAVWSELIKLVNQNNPVKPL